MPGIPEGTDLSAIRENHSEVFPSAHGRFGVPMSPAERMAAAGAAAAPPAGVAAGTATRCCTSSGRTADCHQVAPCSDGLPAPRGCAGGRISGPPRRPASSWAAAAPRGVDRAGAAGAGRSGDSCAAAAATAAATAARRFMGPSSSSSSLVPLPSVCSSSSSESGSAQRTRFLPAAAPRLA